MVLTKQIAEQAIENSDSRMLKNVFHVLEDRRLAWKRAANRENPLEATNEANIEYIDAKLPWIARCIFESSNLADVVTARAANFEIWSARLEEHDSLRKVRASLPADVCPWAYPILIEHRSQQDIHLRRRGVPVFTFGDTLHPELSRSDKLTRDDARYLSERLLLLGVHEGLSAREVEEAAETVNRWLEARPTLGNALK